MTANFLFKRLNEYTYFSFCAHSYFEVHAMKEIKDGILFEELAEYERKEIIKYLQMRKTCNKKLKTTTQHQQ